MTQIGILPATVRMPEGLGRPDDPPSAVIAPGLVLALPDGRYEIRNWVVEGPWPHHCVTPDGVDLYFGHTLAELQAIAAHA